MRTTRRKETIGGRLADKLSEKSKDDRAMIVGSEIRAALEELRQENLIMVRELKYQGDVIGLPSDGDRHKHLVNEVNRLSRWVSDLQSVMYINCVYCGHRYGPQDQVPASMADVLKEHIEQCPAHPMSALKTKLTALERRVERSDKFLRSAERCVEPPASFCKDAWDYIRLARNELKGEDCEERTEPDPKVVP